MEMIFKLQSNITRVKLFRHHNFFEWAPCIETFGFFAKCAKISLQEEFLQYKHMNKELFSYPGQL